jgi:hypothetical protein
VAWSVVVDVPFAAILAEDPDLIASVTLDTAGLTTVTLSGAVELPAALIAVTV